MVMRRLRLVLFVAALRRSESLRSPLRSPLRSSLRSSVRMDASAVRSVAFEPDLNGAAVRIGIISTRWNPRVVGSLKDGAKETLLSLGVKDENIFETSVPGSWELPSAARFLALSGTVDAILCVGCLVKGDTPHFEYIADAVATGLMSVQLQTSVPCTFGVLTVLTPDQAARRSYDGDNHGVSWAKTAVEMAKLRQSALGLDKRGFLSLSASGDAGAGGAGDPPPAKQTPPDKKIYF